MRKSIASEDIRTIDGESLAKLSKLQSTGPKEQYWEIVL